MFSKTIKISKNNLRYIIQMENEFFVCRSRNFIFRTREQLFDFMNDFIDQYDTEKITNKGLYSIEFQYKDKEYTLLFSIELQEGKTSPVYIVLKYLLKAKSHKYLSLIENGFTKDRIFDMKDYKIQTRIVPRKYIDIVVCTQKYNNNTKVKMFISNFLHVNKQWFFEKYGSGYVLIKIAGVIFDKSDIPIDDVVDKEPFWLWLKEKKKGEYNPTDTKEEKYLCCCSLRKSSKKEDNYELLLDGIEGVFIDKKIEWIKKNEERLYDITIELERREVRTKINQGLQIVKKGG